MNILGNAIKYKCLFAALLEHNIFALCHRIRSVNTYSNICINVLCLWEMVEEIGRRTAERERNAGISNMTIITESDLVYTQTIIPQFVHIYKYGPNVVGDVERLEQFWKNLRCRGRSNEW